jgi:hypothetical protein
MLDMQRGLLALVPSPLNIGWCVCFYRVSNNHSVQCWLTHGGTLAVFHSMGAAMNGALVHSVDGTPAKVLPLQGGRTDGMYWSPTAPFSIAAAVPAEAPAEQKPWKRTAKVAA